MENIAAFYKNDDGMLLQAPNFVIGPGFELRKEQASTYPDPVQGWFWYDSLILACEASGLSPAEWLEPEIITYPNARN